MSLPSGVDDWSQETNDAKAPKFPLGSSATPGAKPLSLLKNSCQPAAKLK
jgi:hypothetical protein